MRALIQAHASVWFVFSSGMQGCKHNVCLEVGAHALCNTTSYP